jgi:hypothetical protein
MFHAWNTSPVSILIPPSRGHIKEPITAPYITTSPGYICSLQSLDSHHALRVLHCPLVLLPRFYFFPSKMTLEKDSKYSFSVLPDRPPSDLFIAVNTK